MKPIVRIGSLSAVLLAIGAGLALPAYASVVYDNTTALLGTTTFTAPDVEAGTEVTLAGAGRTVTEFQFIYRAGGISADGDERAIVRFRRNDAAGGAPGTILYESAPIPITPAFDEVVAIQGLDVEVPDSFTWTVQFEGISQVIPDALTMLVYTPTTVGTDSGRWSRLGTLWFLTPGAGFYARITAADPVPALPSSSWVLGAALTLGALGLARVRAMTRRTARAAPVVPRARAE